MSHSQAERVNIQAAESKTCGKRKKKDAELSPDERRKKQNREAAAKCREKKRLLIDQLESQVKNLVNEKKSLEDHVRNLTAENRALFEKNRRLETVEATLKASFPKFVKPADVTAVRSTLAAALPMVQAVQPTIPIVQPQTVVAAGPLVDLSSFSTPLSVSTSSFIEVPVEPPPPDPLFVPPADEYIFQYGDFEELATTSPYEFGVHQSYTQQPPLLRAEERAFRDQLRRRSLQQSCLKPSFQQFPSSQQNQSRHYESASAFAELLNNFYQIDQQQAQQAPASASYVNYQPQHQLPPAIVNTPPAIQFGLSQFELTKAADGRPSVSRPVYNNQFDTSGRPLQFDGVRQYDAGVRQYDGDRQCQGRRQYGEKLQFGERMQCGSTVSSVDLLSPQIARSVAALLTIDAEQLKRAIYLANEPSSPKSSTVVTSSESSPVVASSSSSLVSSSYVSSSVSSSLVSVHAESLMSVNRHCLQPILCY